MSGETMQEMIDHFAIMKVIQRYCRGADRCDRALLESCYWEDATDSHGTYEGTAAGFIDFVIPIVRENYSATTHMLGQSSIEISGDVAAVETYVFAVHRLANSPTPFINMLGGRYVDRFERRHGEWRIADRILVVDWLQNQADDKVPEGVRALSLDLYRNGRRDADDFGSALLNRVRGMG